MRRLLVLLAVVFVTAWPAEALAGYTHYWSWLKKPDPARVKACLDDMEKLARARPDLVVPQSGPDFRVILPVKPQDEAEADAMADFVARAREAGLPDVIEGEHISLNGIGDDGHETFVFPGYFGFNFCKTAYKPYDAVVTAALIAARAHFPPDELEIASDGDWGDWSAGRRLYEKTFEKDPPNPLLAADEPQPDKRTNLLVSGALVALGFVAWLVMRIRGRAR
jgi:hypothetical protein